MRNQSNNILLVLNPVAGGRRALALLPRITAAIERERLEMTVHTTSGPGDAIKTVANTAGQYGRIICCGGDGTLNEVVTGLAAARLRVPVGYIPAGTTNDLARALGLPLRGDKMIDTAVLGRVREHDIGVFNGDRFFTYVASFGAFTKSSYATPQWLKNIAGHTAYVLNSISDISEIHPIETKVTAGGKTVTGGYIFGSVSNSTSIAGMIKLPKNDISFNDGIFETLLIENPGNLIEFQNILNGLLHHDYNRPHIAYMKSDEISFTFNHDVSWTTDGEYAGRHRRVDIKIMRGFLQIAVP